MLLSVWKNWIKVIFLDGWIPGHVEHKRLLTSEMMSGSEMMYHNESHKKGLHFVGRDLTNTTVIS